MAHSSLFTVQNWLDESGDGPVAPWGPYSTAADGNSMQDAAYEEPGLFNATAAADPQRQVSQIGLDSSCCCL